MSNISQNPSYQGYYSDIKDTLLLSRIHLCCQGYYSSTQDTTLLSGHYSTIRKLLYHQDTLYCYIGYYSALFDTPLLLPSTLLHHPGNYSATWNSLRSVETSSLSVLLIAPLASAHVATTSQARATLLVVIVPR